ncbi:MAG: tRNA 2-thiouridine(34) synthase MnmA [Candidatus Pacebacteria bacterium]|nr:tRNA 2-thiouridine(34) synthase MnmA [Candidatus Paceibacterota bacterium]
MTKKGKVIVAMSGGVDSGMAASILKDQGFEVTGIFMRLNYRSGAIEKKAREIAELLKIPFLVLDLRKEFNKKIINYFLKELKKGNTPNPCVFCNEEIKFGLFFEKARKLKPDFMATGHYVKIKKQGKEVGVLKAEDKTKDQTYFLWRLNQDKLRRVLFPMGGLIKEKVKKEALKKGFPIFPYSESQEICFIQGKTEDFLKKNLRAKKGKIVDEKGKVLGQHQGLWFYTIGQRKGIGFAGGPYYVIKKDARKNLLIVSKNEKLLLQKKMQLKNVNWLRKVSLPLKVKARIRYGQKESRARVYSKNKKIFLEFEKSQRAITSGQSAVFYQKDELLGGGIIT